MKNLENFEVQTLNEEEMRNVDGGFPILLGIALVALVVTLSGCGSAKGLGAPGCSRN